MATRGTVIVLDAMNTQVVCPNNTVENTIWSYVLPGGWMKENSGIRLSIISTVTASANMKRLRGYFGGFLFLSAGQNGGTSKTYYFQRTVLNRNSLNAQISENENCTILGSSVDAVVTGTVNTANDITMSITIQKDAAAVAAGNVAAVEKITLEFLP